MISFSLTVREKDINILDGLTQFFKLLTFFPCLFEIIFFFLMQSLVDRPEDPRDAI